MVSGDMEVQVTKNDKNRNCRRLLMTSRFVGNILASSMYGVVFSAGMNVGNLEKMTIVFVMVVFVLAPGILYVTKGEKQQHTV